MSKKAGKPAAPTAPVDVKGKKRAADVAAAPAKVKKPEKIKLRRVHASGLPAGLSEEDVKNRFKSFGEVQSVDNLGKLDGNGWSLASQEYEIRYRNLTISTGYPLLYAFLDIQTTKSKLAQCKSRMLHGCQEVAENETLSQIGMNLLSGSVWKGSTLRIAEAKPTYMERCVPKAFKACIAFADSQWRNGSLARERQSEADKMQATSAGEPAEDGLASVPIDKPAGSKKRKRAEGSESTHQQLVDAETAKARDVSYILPQ